MKNIPHQKYEASYSFNELFNYIMYFSNIITLYYIFCLVFCIKLFRGTVRNVKLTSYFKIYLLWKFYFLECRANFNLNMSYKAVYKFINSKSSWFKKWRNFRTSLLIWIFVTFVANKTTKFFYYYQFKNNYWTSYFS